MKNIFRHVSITLIAVATVSLNTAYADSFQVQKLESISLKHQPDTEHISHLQSKAQVEYFKQALDELGATSPEQVVEIWVKAEQTRNGVYHYAVACDELKSKIIKEWGEPKESFWNIGGSSPWLDKYEILYNKKLNDLTYEVKIKFYWVTSAGPTEITENTLTISKNKNIWCVKEVR